MTTTPAPRRTAALARPLRGLAVVALLALIALGLGLVGMQLWAAYHYRAARAALDRYHAVEAGDHLDACLRVWPNDPDVLFLAARAARRAGLYDPAEDFLNRCQERRGHDDELVLERALLTAERGKVDDVLKFCKARVSANDPATPLILEAVARACLRGDTYRLADADWALQTWREREPDNPMALLLRGRLDQERYADADAADAYRRALEIDPELDDARDRLTRLLLETNQPAEALPHLEYLHRRRPDDAAISARLAQGMDLAGRQDEAARLLDEVLAHHPDFGPALAARGKLALQAGQYADAETWLRRAYERTPWDTTLLSALQNCLAQSGQAEKARELEPQVKQAREDMERLDRLMGQDLQKNPNNAAAQCEAGKLLLRIGARDDGVRRLMTATRIDPSYAPAHEALADFYERTGESLKAAKHRRLAGQTAEK